MRMLRDLTLTHPKLILKLGKEVRFARPETCRFAANELSSLLSDESPRTTLYESCQEISKRLPYAQSEVL
jgi:glucose-6-phosphate-specific signal transduction histidine kinase